MVSVLRSIEVPAIPILTCVLNTIDSNANEGPMRVGMEIRQAVTRVFDHFATHDIGVQRFSNPTPSVARQGNQLGFGADLESKR